VTFPEGVLGKAKLADPSKAKKSDRKCPGLYGQTTQ